MKYFYRTDKNKNPIPGTLARLPKKPETGSWVEVTNTCCGSGSCEPNIFYYYDASDMLAEGDFIIEINGTPVVELLNAADGIYSGVVNPQIGDTVTVTMTNEVLAVASLLAIIGQVNIAQRSPVGGMTYSFVWDGTRATNVFVSISALGE